MELRHHLKSGHAPLFEQKKQFSKPFDFLNNNRGKMVVVETRTGETFTGSIMSYDENITLEFVQANGGKITIPGSRIGLIYPAPK